MATIISLDPLCLCQMIQADKLPLREKDLLQVSACWKAFLSTNVAQVWSQLTAWGPYIYPKKLRLMLSSTILAL